MFSAGARYLTQRCTSMYHFGIPSHIVRPITHIKITIFAKTAFTNMAAKWQPYYGSLVGYDTDAQFYQISITFL